MVFEWDPAKAAVNRLKHGVAFEEAISVFRDPKAVVRYDSKHSDGEERYIAIGISERGRLLAVVYTERDGKIRIINARRVTASEVKAYAQR